MEQFCPTGCPTDCLHQLARSLGNTVDARDAVTFNHSRDVARIGTRLALALGLNAAETESVHIAGHLHDIGKIGIPDAILRKQAPLQQDEWLWMHRHPAIGANILHPVGPLGDQSGVARMVLHHHERFDGSGYPGRLAGNDIPRGARIIAVADTLSALLQDRPYRPGTSMQEALHEVRRAVGNQLDPAVVAALGQVSERLEDELAELLAPGPEEEWRQLLLPLGGTA